MKKVFLSVLSLACVVLCMTSCGKNGGFKKTDSGLSYKFYQENKDARKAEMGDVIVGEIIVHTADSVLFKNTGNPDRILMVEQSMFAGDLSEGLLMLHEGDSVTFKISADSLRKFVGLPDFVGTELMYTVKVNKLMNQKEIEAEVNTKFSEEKKALADFAKNNNITVQPTESGLYIIEMKKGSGKKVEAGKTASVDYTGALLDGTIFDSSIEKNAFDAGVGLPQREYKPMDVQIGSGQVIPGMEEALLKMQVGGKAKVYIPSSMAYGDRGNLPVIAPYSTLVFEIEVKDVK